MTIVRSVPHLVDGVAIPGSNLPTLLICHQFGFCITIPEIYHQSPSLVESKWFKSAPPTLLQVLAVPLCQHHGGEGQSCWPVLCLLQSKNLVNFSKLHKRLVLLFHSVFVNWTHPCLPCAHPPLVKPVTNCHRPNEAGEDDWGIQNLKSRFFQNIFLIGRKKSDLSCGDPAEVDGSITSLGWQVLLVWSRGGHHTTRSKTIWRLYKCLWNSLCYFIRQPQVLSLGHWSKAGWHGWLACLAHISRSCYNYGPDLADFSHDSQCSALCVFRLIVFRKVHVSKLLGWRWLLLVGE